MTKPKKRSYRGSGVFSRSKKHPGEFKTIPNTYYPYNLESGLLFYRKDVIGKIKGILNFTPPKRLIVIQGFSGSGKTSTLRKMVDDSSILGERFLPVYLRLSEIKDFNLENYLSFFNTSIINVMKNLRLNTSDIFIPGTSLQETMRLVDAFEAGVGNDKTMVFIFDDVERIQRIFSADERATVIFPFFHFLLKSKDTSRLVLAGEGEVSDWLKEPGQKGFLKIDAVIDLEKSLDDNVFKSLIVEPVEGYVQYEHEAIRKIIEVTGGNLYCQQLLCFYIVRHLNRIKKNVCTRLEVQQAIKNTINDERQDFTFFWEGMPYERKIAAAALTDDRVIKNEGAYYFIKEPTLLNYIFLEDDLKNILKKLIDDRYINRMSGRRFDGAPYRVPLFGEWVKVHHSFPKTLVDNWEAVTKRVSLAHLSEIIKIIPANSLPFDYQTANHIISLSEAWRSLRTNMKSRRIDRENIEEIIKICCTELDFKIIGKPENGKTFFLIDTRSLNLSGLDETRLFFLTSEEPDCNEIHNIQEKIQQHASQSSFFSFLICIRTTNVIKELIRKEYLGIILITEDDIKKLSLTSNPIQVFKEDIIKPQVKPSRISKYQTQGPATITFYGRHDEIGKILGADKKNFAIVGARKIGKTSLLKQLEKKFPSDTTAVYMDLESPQEQDYHIFLQALQNRLDYPISDDLALGDALDGLHKFVVYFCRKTGNHLVLLLDEMDILLKYDEAHDYRLLKTFRALSQEGYCQFILSGFKQLSEAADNHESPLYNYCEFIHLGKLKEKDALALITDPMDAVGVKYDNLEDRKLILEYTSCHPNLLQFFCKKLIERIEQHENEKDKRTIYRQDIQEFYETFDYESYVLYDFYLFTSSNMTPVERLIVLSLLDEYSEEKIFTTSDIDKKLQNHNIKIDTGRLNRYLRNLRLRYIFDAVKGGMYRFALPAFPILLKKRKDLLSLIEKEVEHVGKSL